MTSHTTVPWIGWLKRILAMPEICALLLLIFLWVTSAANLPAQSPSDSSDQPRFEVASVKQNKPTGSGPQYSVTATQPGGRLVATAVQLRGLITWAYQLKADEARLISGLPDWAKSESFDIEAQAEGNPSKEQMLLMLQSLMADRFKLALHHESREVPVYALVLAKAGKAGPQLQTHSESAPCIKLGPSQLVPTTDFGVIPPPPPACGRFISGAHRVAGNDVTIDMLAANLGALSSMDRPVVNRTGLSGHFDLELGYETVRQQGSEVDLASPSDLSGPSSIFTALQEQLGLKLEPTKGPVDVLVIDHVEQPSPN
jgi:uncharacterized protein (TIGR03435 family)